MAKNRILVPFDAEQLARIDAYRRGRALPTRVGAIRELIDRGLAVSEPLAGAIAALRAAKPTLAAEGISHAAVFGSVARGEAAPESDIDVMIDFDPDRYPDLFRHFELCQMVADRVGAATGRKVDVVSRGSLRDRIRARVEADAVSAF